MIRPVEDGVPAFMLRNVSRDGRYVIEKLVLADPRRDVVLQHVRCKAQSGARLPPLCPPRGPEL
jgi:glucoamylase